MPRGIYKHNKGYKRPPFSKEWKKRISESNKGKNIGENNPAKRQCVREKISQAMKGNTNSLGNVCSEETKTKLRVALSGDKNSQWKGDKVSYREIHKWVRRLKGIPKKCSKCGKNFGRIEWANVSGKYERDLNDFIELCKSCHYHYDKKGKD